jgi:hypothetical protein
MKTKSLGIILILAVLLLAWGSAYSRIWSPVDPLPGHPWEGSSKMVKDDPKVKVVIMIPIFSDFLIWIYIKGVHKESERQENSVEMGDNSYQIIFPW